MMAEWTGLEPATSGVTGQHSNRLNYHSAETDKFSGPLAASQHFREKPLDLVGTEGIEPPTRSV